MAEAVVIKTAQAWARQALEACDRMREANGGVDPPTIRDGDALDHEAFCSLVEAMLALEPVTGRPVSQELIDAAGLRPVTEVLGLA